MKNITFVPSSVKRTKPDKALVTFKIASEDFSNIEKGLYKQYKRQINTPMQVSGIKTICEKRKTIFNECPAST